MKCLRTSTQGPGQHKVPKANEAKKRIPLGKSRQGLKKTAVRNIDLKDFKFPPRPQTPDATDLAAWTPGSGFDSTHPSTTSTFKRNARGRQRLRSTSGVPQPAARHAFKAVDFRISKPITPRRLFDAGNLHDGHHLPNNARLLAGAVTAEAAKTSEEYHPPHVTSNGDYQTYETAHLRSKHQQLGRALAEALDRTSSSREGSPRTAELSLPYGARSRNRPSMLSDSAAPNVEAGDAGNTVHMGLLNASPVRPYYVSSHPPSSVHPSLPLHDTKSSSEPRLSSHRSLQIPFPYHSYPYPPSSAPPRPLPHHSEGRSEDEDVEEASETTSTDAGFEQLETEEASSEEADEDQSISLEATEAASPITPHSPHANSPPQSTSSSEAMLEETWHDKPSSPIQPLQGPTLVTGGYFTTAIEQLNAPSKQAQTLPSLKTRAAMPSIPRAGEEDYEGVLQLGISPSLERSFLKGAFKPPFSMGMELMRREMGY